MRTHRSLNLSLAAAAVIIVWSLIFIAVRHLRRDPSSDIRLEWLKAGSPDTVASTKILRQLVQSGTERGKKDLAQSEIANVRLLYGSEGIRLGHVMWISRVLNGDLDPGMTPPSFAN